MSRIEIVIYNLDMALSIKDPEADRLARELAARTGETLTEAVDIMGRLQLGKKFTAEENAQLVAFLKTLTDGYAP